MISSLFLTVLLSQAPVDPAAAAPAAPAAPAAQAQPVPAATPAAVAPAAAPEKKPEAKPFAPKVTFWGFVNTQWSRTAPPSPGVTTSTFELRRARIGARGDITPYTGFAVLWDGADTALKDAYASLKNLPGVPGVELRLGQWKTPFGYEQPESDTKLLWVNSSYIVANVARATTIATATTAADSRDAGLGLVGGWELGPVKTDLAVSFVNGVGPNKKDDLDEKNVWARVGGTVKAGPASVRAGLSYGNGRQVVATGANAKFDGIGAAVDDTYQWFVTYGADVEVDTPWFFCVAEYAKSEKDQRGYATTGTGAAAVTTLTKRAFNASGWYAGVYGKTPWNAGPIVRLEGYDRNDDVKDAENSRLTLGAYVDVAPVNARLVLNYELDRSDEAVKTGDKLYVFGQLMF